MNESISCNVIVEDEALWLATLRKEVAATSMTKVARKIDYSPAAISQVLNYKYKGNVSRVEEAVRGAFLGETLGCPVLGEIPKNQCLSHQKKPFALTNPQRIALWKSCNGGCKHSHSKQGE